MGGDLRDIATDYGGPANVLLLASPFSPGSRDGCTELLSPPEPVEYAALFVLTTESTDARIEDWRADDARVAPRQIGVVDLWGSSQSAQESRPSSTPSLESDVRIETVPNAGNLSKLGISIVKLLEWIGEDRHLVLCFDSVTTLLHYVDTSAMYRFLAVLTTRVTAYHATAHYHLDPTVHSERDVTLLQSLFDAVVDVDDEDQWRVRAR